MGAMTRADSLHRLVKEAIDSGQAATIEEAQALLSGYRITFRIDNSGDADHQAALLTGIALARRVFLGGVFVTGELDVPLAVPLPLGRTLGNAVRSLGARADEAPPDDIPAISVTARPQARLRGFHVRTVFDGWRGGIVPAHAKALSARGKAMALSPMLAAAIAVNEAYMFVRGESGNAGLRPHGVSLWQPAAEHNWLAPDASEPGLVYLPARLWLIGLGHLGQAYLWALGLLPYQQPAGLELVLQDVDEITVSNESTSILSDASVVGQKKTRVLAAWAERRGFRTAIHERLFDENFRRQDGEPAVALCGLDNALGRQPLDQVGFDFVIEAGLGRDHRNFQTMRIHTLPAKRAAAEIWKSTESVPPQADRAAYQSLIDSGQLDQCGVTLLAGKAVGAPFVGSVAACLVVTEVLRLLHGGDVHELIDLDLRSIDHRLVVRQARDFGALNPGYVLAAGLPPSST